jgi:hypothetical protein
LGLTQEDSAGQGTFLKSFDVSGVVVDVILVPEILQFAGSGDVILADGR